MAEPTILITAAAGKTGSAVVRELRAADLSVRAVVRQEDSRSEGVGSARRGDRRRGHVRP